MAHYASKMARLIKRAGGKVSRSGDHLRVTGPDGSAVIGAELGDPRTWRNIRNQLRRHTGIHVKGTP